MTNDKTKSKEDCYRDFENIFEPDIRGVALFNTINLEGWHKYVDQHFSIKDFVPNDVRVQLETIKNLFLYSYFVYRFATVAKTQVYNTLELSLELKFKEENIPPLRGLRRKLDKALSAGWIMIDDISQEDMQKRIEALAGLRNDLNHGSTMLMDPLTLLHAVDLHLEIITSLFRNRLHQ